MTRPLRALVHVQHLLGVGHLRRALTLSHALADAGVATTLASGGYPVPNLPIEGIEFVQLPAARAADATFKLLLDADGAPIDDAWRERRRDALLRLFARVDPDILVIELFPFGRRQLRFELEPLLAAARARAIRPVVASSLRDILHPPSPPRIDGMVAAVAEDFDLVLVHGDPQFIGLELSFPAVDRLGDKLCYTGYLTEPMPRRLDRAGAPEVIVSCGGGAVGEPLLRAALEARALSRYRDDPWRILIGHNLGEAPFAALRRQAPDGVAVERARTDFPALLPGALCSVSQAGYNTAIEVLTARVPAVFVPFADEGEIEQTLRCRALASKGLCQWVTPEALTPANLAQAIDRAAAPPHDHFVKTDGAKVATMLLLHAATEKAKLAAVSSALREP